ncbi:hypothetical protein [Cohnella boryungensis]|uniref:LPS export ABC transporter periplasmic protein LptC n=1 Tax=Cohnella boryungensis TaxID=768479 RepID=A0ABV8SHP8_9BACL
MNSKLVTILGIPLVLILMITAYFMFPWMAIFIGIHSESDPPSPQIKYGEFPFRLEYEQYGQTIVIEDTLICEYVGNRADEGRGKYREWKQSIASGKERITLFKEDDTTEIYFPTESANYFMGDTDTSTDDNQNLSLLSSALIIEKVGRGQQTATISASELLNNYGIKLIKWDIKQPIKNSFS